MFDLSLYVEKITQLKKQNPKCLTNNFLNYNELQLLSKKENVELLYNKEAIVILDNDNNVNRVYFILSSLENANMLSKLLELGNLDKPYIIDCLGKEAFLENLKDAFESNGINLYTKMNRWRANKLHNLLKLKQTDSMMPAKLEDVNEIKKLLDEVFDPYVSHLPDKDKLINLVKSNLVFCIKDNNKIVAVFCFEKFWNESFYVYQIAVHKDFRGCGLGKNVVHYALSNYKNRKIYTSWIEYDNLYSQKIHQEVGFEKDGLSDYVFIYK